MGQRRVKHFYIDDSGWGCPVGGVSIGVLNEKGKGQLWTLPVILFQEDTIDTSGIGEYIIEDIDYFLRVMLKAESEDVIHVCRGPIFKPLIKYLNQKTSFNCICDKIKGIHQKTMEEFHCNYLKRLGVPIKSQTGHGGRSFKWYVNWINEDKSKLNITKTAWKGLEKWIKYKK